MIAAVGFMAGRTVFNRRAYIAVLEERAATAEAGRAAATARAVADERRRIARELHDIVAHHISVMGVLASGSRRALTRDPAAADEALATIEQTGRSVLREMRRLLDVLRDGDSDGGRDAMAPQPGIRAIGPLIDQVREAGLPVDYRVDGPVEALGQVVGLTTYRIVQEALTNVLKHAGTATATVRLRLTAGVVELEVADTGRGPAPGSSPAGHGLLGMRERVALHGGTLRIGPRPGGGYRLYATMPVEATDSDGRQVRGTAVPDGLGT
jgi:signal transduction histidine kinase